MTDEMKKSLADALAAWLDDDSGWDAAETLEDQRAADMAQAELFAKHLDRVGLAVITTLPRFATGHDAPPAGRATFQE